jgi:diadenylate cyclase
MIIKGTRATQLMKGLFIFFIAMGVSNWLNLYLMSWLFDRVATVGLIAIVVLFQSEIRHALEQIGRGRFWMISTSERRDWEEAIEEIVKACDELSQERAGAIIVLEREMGLKDIIQGGVRIDSLISADLLANIFIPKTPLHDGAVIIKKNRIELAACFLPLSQGTSLDNRLGTRHRAALGTAELTDSIVIVVSEETGIISVANNGRLTRYLDKVTLRKLLERLYLPKAVKTSFFKPIRRRAIQH